MGVGEIDQYKAEYPDGDYPNECGCTGTYETGFEEGFAAGYAKAEEDFDIELLEEIIGKSCTIICNCGGNGMSQMGELTKVTPNVVVLRTGINTSMIIYRADITVIEWIESR